MFCRKCLEPKWMYTQVLPPWGLSVVLMSSVSLFQKLVVQSGARLGIWRLPQPRWAMAIVYAQKYTVVCAERQVISGLQMADAEFCICKLLCWHVILLKCCLGAEYSYWLLHWCSFLIHGENWRWAGLVFVTLLQSHLSISMFVFHWVFLPCNLTAFLGSKWHLSQRSPQS